MNTVEVPYRGYTLKVLPFDQGWRVHVHKAEHPLAVAIKSTDKADGRHRVIVEAKVLVDEEINRFGSS
jgi:hypothetical protein